MDFALSPAWVADGHAAKAQTAGNPRLIAAAHQFEASLMKELLTPLQTKDPLFADEGESEGNSSNAVADFASEALAKAISDHGGLGIAREVLQSMHQR